MQLLDGKQTSATILAEITEKVRQIVNTGKRPPHLVAILIGNDGASETYVSAKVKACEKVGFKSTLLRFENTIAEQQLIEAIQRLNQDNEVDGFIVQMPFPPHIREEKIIASIAPSKDVDGFHPENVGRMTLNMPCYIAATPYGILQLIERYNIQTSGKHCVVLGRSNIVGSPMSILLAKNSYPGNCTVTLAHSKTQNLSALVQSADILIVAMGKPYFVKAEMVKPGAVVIDVGITRIADPTKTSGYRLAGDVDFEHVAPLCSYITPVPGGVGPMTIVSLLKNTLKAYINEAYS